MKTKNKVWLRLTTSIVIISLLYPNILLAQDRHLAPRSYKKGEMQAVMICETIEKRAIYGKSIERIYLDDILKWTESTEEEFSGCRFETLPHEITIHLASSNIIVRYFDPTKVGDIPEFKTKIIGPRLHRQIIQEVKALPAGKTSQELPSPPKRIFSPLPILVIIASALLLISIFLFTSITTLVLTSGAELIFSTDIAKLLPPLGMVVLLGGFAIGRWILSQIEYGAVLWRKGPIYDLLSRVVPPLKEKPKKPVKFTEYNYKVITNQPMVAIKQGLKLSDSEIEKLRDLSFIEDNARRCMLYYGNRLAGIVTVSEMAHGIIQVEVEWTSRKGKRQLSEDFIVEELANRNPAGILFHSSDIDAEIIDTLLPNHIIADTKESTRRFKEKVFSRLEIDDKGQYTFFAMDRQDFSERRRLYFGSFRFSSLWRIAEIDHWIFSFASGLFFALVFSSIFSHAEAVKVLASYTFFEEYINLILTVLIAPLAARSIAKVIRLKWDPVRSRHGKLGSENAWLSIVQGMRMGWKMIGMFKTLAYSRIFLSILGLLLIPAIGVTIFVIIGFSSPYIYLGLMFLKLVTERIINEYEHRYYKEVSEVAIVYNEAAKREGYAENFHNIDSTSEVFRELIYASGLLIGYGISTCSILSPAVIPLAILAAIAIPMSSFLIPIMGRDYKNYLKMWGKGFTPQSGGKVLLAEGVTMITNPENPLVVHPRPMPVTDYFSILPWVEQLGVTIECKPGHRPIIEPKNPGKLRGLRPKKGRYILNWPEEELRIELISREGPIIDNESIVIEDRTDGWCIIRFYPKKGIAAPDQSGIKPVSIPKLGSIPEINSITPAKKFVFLDNEEERRLLLEAAKNIADYIERSDIKVIIPSGHSGIIAAYLVVLYMMENGYKNIPRIELGEFRNIFEYYRVSFQEIMDFPKKVTRRYRRFAKSIRQKAVSAYESLDIETGGLLFIEGAVVYGLGAHINNMFMKDVLGMRPDETVLTAGLMYTGWLSFEEGENVTVQSRHAQELGDYLPEFFYRFLDGMNLFIGKKAVELRKALDREVPKWRDTERQIFESERIREDDHRYGGILLNRWQLLWSELGLLVKQKAGATPPQKPRPSQKPVDGIGKDIAGKLAGDADPRLIEWLKQNTPDNTKVIDYYYEEGKWVPYKVKYIEDYTYEMDDKGEPMAEAKYQLSVEEQRRLNKVMEECTYDETGRQVRFRVVLGETAVGWSEDKNIDHSSFIHVGERTTTIWFGEGLFMDLLSRDSDPLRGRVFSHEKRHILGDKGIDEGREYEDLTKDVCERCREIEKRKAEATPGLYRLREEATRYVEEITSKNTASIAVDPETGERRYFSQGNPFIPINAHVYLMEGKSWNLPPGIELPGYMNEVINTKDGALLLTTGPFYVVEEGARSYRFIRPLTDREVYERFGLRRVYDRDGKPFEIPVLGIGGRSILLPIQYTINRRHVFGLEFKDIGTPAYRKHNISSDFPPTIFKEHVGKPGIFLDWWHQTAIQTPVGLSTKDIYSLPRESSLLGKNADLSRWTIAVSELKDPYGVTLRVPVSDYRRLSIFFNEKGMPMVDVFDAIVEELGLSVEGYLLRLSKNYGKSFRNIVETGIIQSQHGSIINTDILGYCTDFGDFDEIKKYNEDSLRAAIYDWIDNLVKVLAIKGPEYKDTANRALRKFAIGFLGDPEQLENLRIDVDNTKELKEYIFAYVFKLKIETHTKRVIQRFKEMYGQEILEKIRREERYRLFAGERGLDINILQEVIFKKEMGFCEHILEHLVTILEKANGRLGKERIFVINTSMLYDVDETIGTDDIHSWHIRPSIIFLFRFLKDNFNIKLGIVSTRGKEFLDKQLQPGYEGFGTLAEIADFVDPATVYSIPLIDEQALLYDRLLTIYPGFKIFDPKATLRGLGWDEEMIDRFEKVIGPGLFKESKRDLYALHYDNLDDPEQKRKLEEEVEEAFRDILIKPDPIGRMLSEVGNLYDYFFAPGNKKTDNERNELLSKLEGFGVNLSELETIARIYGEYSNLAYKQIAKNRRVIDEFRRKISDILGLRKGKEDLIIETVYRLAAAKDLLDKGLSEVSVTVDNLVDIAEGLYELFIGKRRGPGGEDGFTLFGLEKYRDRLFIFSTSMDGVYSAYDVTQATLKRKQKIITERFIDNIKGIPAKTDNKKIILALDTDIGNMTQLGIGELLKQVRDVSGLLGDIEFVAEEGADLAGAVRKAVGGRKDVDVIVVTKKKKEDFDSSYHVTRVDDTRLAPGSYVPILELLTFALVLNLEEDPQLLKDIYKELTGNDLDNGLKPRIRNGESAIPLLPTAEKIPEDSYNISIEVLKSA